MAKKELTYTDAINEVEEIVSQIESNELDVDKLTDSVKRVAKLLNYCKAKLRATEEEVEGILNELDE